MAANVDLIGESIAYRDRDLMGLKYPYGNIDAVECLGMASRKSAAVIGHSIDIVSYASGRQRKRHRHG
jgi:hypothetical protein